MYKKIILAIALMAFPFIVSCDYTTNDGVINDEAASAANSAFKVFNDAFIPSGAEFSGNFYDTINGSLVEWIINLAQEDEFWFESPAYDAILNIGLSGASQKSIQALLDLINDAILNPWTLLENTSFNGQHGCVSWSVGNDMNLETVAGLYNNFWTLTVQTSFNDCPDLDGQVQTVIYGDRIGIVYSVHVTGNFTVASMPGETFSIDVLYNLEDCFKTWDCVDWEGTINGYQIGDIY